MPGDEKYRAEPMRNCFEGIFVREFILFGENQAECYTEEYENNVSIRRNAPRFLSASIPQSDDTSRYAQLCRMEALAGAGRDDELATALANYRQTDLLTRELFKV